jgi:hypothetical protein
MIEVRDLRFAMRLSVDYGGEFGDDDVHEHEVRLAIVGIPETDTVALVRTHPIVPPRILGYRLRGALRLPRSLLDHLMTAAFSDVVEAMILNEGLVESVDVDDGADWVRQHFARSEAVVVITELSRHIDVSDCHAG